MTPHQPAVSRRPVSTSGPGEPGGEEYRRLIDAEVLVMDARVLARVRELVAGAGDQAHLIDGIFMKAETNRFRDRLLYWEALLHKGP